jgi:hypothetical protein
MGWSGTCSFGTRMTGAGISSTSVSFTTTTCSCLRDPQADHKETNKMKLKKECMLFNMVQKYMDKRIAEF